MKNVAVRVVTMLLRILEVSCSIIGNKINNTFEIFLLGCEEAGIAHSV
jgi:hypothetical protein